MELKGKTAVVTGGTKGIGRAITESLIEAGVNVSFSARHESEIERAVVELHKAGRGRAAGFFCDVRDEAQVKAFFAQSVEHFGGVDVLVHNAGFGVLVQVDPTCAALSGASYR